MTTNPTTPRAGYVIEDLAPGMEAAIERVIAEGDLVAFAEVSGDTNPVHLDEAYAATTPFRTRIAHGMLTASLISAVLGTRLPGPGAVYLSQSLRFRAPVKIGDRVRTAARVTEIDTRRRRVTLACACSVGDAVVLDGEAIVMVPSRGREGA
jgi:3-hydroxybutyryl-CoA dehydratase